LAVEFRSKSEGFSDRNRKIRPFRKKIRKRGDLALIARNREENCARAALENG